MENILLDESKKNIKIVGKKMNRSITFVFPYI